MSGSEDVAACSAFVVGEVSPKFGCFIVSSTSTRKTSNSDGAESLVTGSVARESVSASTSVEPFLYSTVNL